MPHNWILREQSGAEIGGYASRLPEVCKKEIQGLKAPKGMVHTRVVWEQHEWEMKSSRVFLEVEDCTSWDSFLICIFYLFKLCLWSPTLWCLLPFKVHVTLWWFRVYSLKGVFKQVTFASF